MNLNEYSQAKSAFSHVIQMVRNHIAKKDFISKFILSDSNSHERFGETMYKFHVKCQIWRHASSPCFKAVGTSTKLYSISHKSMCENMSAVLIPHRKDYKRKCKRYWCPTERMRKCQRYWCPTVKMKMCQRYSCPTERMRKCQRYWHFTDIMRVYQRYDCP